MVEAGTWRDDKDLAEVYTAWGGFAYGRGLDGAAAADDMRTNYRRIKVAAKNIDTREHDIADSDDYFQYHGGMIATVRALTGSDPKAYVGDSTTPGRGPHPDAGGGDRPRLPGPGGQPALDRRHAAARLQGRLRARRDRRLPLRVRRHRWRGARLDVRKARAGVRPGPHHREFLDKSNPWALHGIVERLQEAADRGLWADPSAETLAALQQAYLEVEGDLEDRDPSDACASSASAWDRSTSRPRSPTRCGRSTTSSPRTRVTTTGCSPCAARSCAGHADSVPIVAVRDPARDRSDAVECDGLPRRRGGLARRRVRRSMPTSCASAAGPRRSWSGAIPSLYDSTIRIVEKVRELGVPVEFDVLPGISAPQLLAARHRIVLHEVGRPVHVTTGRRLQEAVAAGQDNIVAMLNPPPDRLDLTGLDDWSIWWGANLGAAGERLVAGRLGEALPADRRSARARQGRCRLGDGPLPGPEGPH